MLFNDPEQLNPKVMTAILRQSGALWERASVADVRVRKSSKIGSMKVHQLAIRYLDARNIRSSPTMVMLCVTPQGDTEAQREVQFYDDFAPLMLKTLKPEKVALIRCHDAHYDEDTQQAHFVLDDASEKFFPPRGGQPPSKMHKERIMDALAQLHAYWWEHENLGEESNQYTEVSINDWLATMERSLTKFMKYMGRRYTDKQRIMLEKAITTLPVQRREQLLTGKKLTLIHGKTKPDDFLYSHNDIRIVRWQHWQAGINTDDLAYFIAAHLPFQVRKFEQKRLLQRYFNSLRLHGIKDYTWEELQQDYAASVANTIALLIHDWAMASVTDNKWEAGNLALQTFEDIDGMNIYD